MNNEQCGVHLGNAPVGSARSCRVRGRGSVVECGSPLPLCDLRTKGRPYAPRAQAKAPEGWRTPKASPRRGVTSSQVIECFQPPQACELLCGKKENGCRKAARRGFAAAGMRLCRVGKFP